MIGRAVTVLAAVVAVSFAWPASATAHVLVDSVAGKVLDVGTDRTLFIESGTPKIKHRPAGTIEVVSGFPPGSAVNAGFLTPHGAIFDVHDQLATFNKVYEWRDGAMAAPNDLVGSLRIAGAFASWWQPPGELVRRDLSTGSSIVVATDDGSALGEPHDVAANGDVIYTGVPSGGSYFQLYRYRNGMTEQLTNDASDQNTAPRTDGANVAYRKTPGCCSPSGSVAVNYAGTGELILNSFRNSLPLPDDDYQIAGGWVAYTRPGTDGRLQVWRHSPAGVDDQVSPSGHSAIVAGVNDAGAVMYSYPVGECCTNLYMSDSPGSSVAMSSRPIAAVSAGARGSASYDFVFWDGSDWLLTKGGKVYRLQPAGTDVSVTQSDAPDPAELGQTVTYTAVVRNDDVTSANDVVVSARFFLSPLDFQDATAPGPCVQSFLGADRQTFTCQMGALDPGETATATLRFTARKNGTFSYTTDASAFEVDPDASDNTFVSATTIRSYVRPKGATPTLVSLVPANQPCSAPNRLHEGPLAYDSCSPSAATSPNVTVGTGDAGGGFPNMIGSLRLDVCPVAGCTAPNVAIRSAVSDLRCKSPGSLCGAANTAGASDYVGELASVLRMRITDSWSGPTADIPATVVDLDFPVTTPCAPTTGDATKGSDCSLTTTANAVLANTFATGKRSIVELGQARVTDGGPDGDADTKGDNSLFAVQGVFLP